MPVNKKFLVLAASAASALAATHSRKKRQETDASQQTITLVPETDSRYVEPQPETLPTEQQEKKQASIGKKLLFLAASAIAILATTHSRKNCQETDASGQTITLVPEENSRYAEQQAATLPLEQQERNPMSIGQKLRLLVDRIVGFFTSAFHAICGAARNAAK